MIVDASAIIAILREEPEAAALAHIMDGASSCRLSAVGYVEAAAVIDGSRSPVSSRRFDDFMREAEIMIEPVTANQARIAREAYRDFGKGQHKARLNLGDCFAYALAKEKRETLLFKGNDFRHTDVEPA